MNLSELKLTDKRKSICNQLNLFTTEDVLNYFPYRYEYYKKTNYEDFVIGSNVLFECILITKPITYYFGKRNTTRFKVLCDDNELSITIFNRNWINKTKVGTRLTIYGKYEGNNKITAINYYLKHIEDVEGINPIYSLKDGFTQNEIKKLIDIAFEHNGIINEFVPEEYLLKHGLISYSEALINIHKPNNIDDLKKALARIKYNEFLVFFSCLNIFNFKINIRRTFNNPFDIKKIDNLIKTLPFSLTDDQNLSLNEIMNDLNSDKLMRRLLQGEVGSGKTIIAELSLYANYLKGYQGALMAPTEVLANQHYKNFSKLFINTDIKIALLTSSIDSSDDIKEKIESGDIDIVIGTHSLFQKDVSFKNLGYIVIDEQQRFGVNQRNMLKSKGENVDLLLMSATPIPRTLATSLYGGFDISTIKTMPLNRKGCDTFFINENSIKSIVDRLKEILRSKKQIYIIASSITQSNNTSIKDLNRLYKSLEELFNPYTISYLHGKMSFAEKKDVMDKFYNNEINILLSTTVVEVGVDVSNATCMVVYNAERFGLSQLHQLRGRIQRGSSKGEFYLLSDTDDEDSKKRLDTLCATNDGFEISLFDLKQRGPGDIIGTKQSGLPSFHLANIVEDTKILEGAKNDAYEIMNNDNNCEYRLYINKLYKKLSIE